MPGTKQQQLQAVFLTLLPADHGFVGNAALLEAFRNAAREQGVRASDTDFHNARESLIAEGQAVKGRGRGGSTARSTGASRPNFALEAEAVAPDLLVEKRPAKTSGKSVPKSTAPGDPQVLSYRHPDRRKNNPEVGLVNETSDPERPKTTWAYDPHLDPALQFDSARADAEKLIEDALAGDDPVAMRRALEELRRMGTPKRRPNTAKASTFKAMAAHSNGYLWNGSKRKYIPDFLIRYQSGKMLVLEVKGQDSPQDQAKRAALGQWVDAVNAHRGFGAWAWDVVAENAAGMQDAVARHAGK